MSVVSEGIDLATYDHTSQLRPHHVMRRVTHEGSAESFRPQPSPAPLTPTAVG